MCVIRAAAGERSVSLEHGNTRLGEIGQKPPDLCHHFRTDAVAGKKKEFVRGHKFRLASK